MATDLSVLLDRRTLIAVVNSPDLQVRPTFVHDMFFKSNAQTVFTDAVDYEIELAKPTLARFRNEGQAANVVSKTKRRIATVRLPYIREKKQLTAKELKKNAPLENVYINGAADIDKMRAATIARELSDLKNRILRRIEWMCCAQLTAGKIEYADEEVSFSVDLQMPSDNKETLSGTAKWGAADADVYSDIRRWNQEIQNATGINAGVAIHGRTAAAKFLKDEGVKKDLDNLNYRAGSAVADVTSAYLGRVYGIDHYSYTHQYYNEADGLTYDMFPDNMVVLLPAPAQFETSLLYGPVEETSGTYAGQFFSKTWEENDPSTLWMLVASRPLPIIKRQGSWFAAIVCDSEA